MEQCLNGSDKYLQLRMLFAIHYLGLVFFVIILSHLRLKVTLLIVNQHFCVLVRKRVYLNTIS